MLSVWKNARLNEQFRPRNDLLCVEWNVKPYALTHLASYGTSFAVV